MRYTDKQIEFLVHMRQLSGMTPAGTEYIKLYTNTGWYIKTISADISQLYKVLQRYIKRGATKPNDTIQQLVLSDQMKSLLNELLNKDVSFYQPIRSYDDSHDIALWKCSSMFDVSKFYK